MARSENFKVGLLVLTATLLLAAAIGVITGLRLRQPEDRYSIRFDESVSGLDQGADVKYRGVKVGTVRKLTIPPDDITKVEVWIGIKEGTPIRADTKAKLTNVGITGLKFVDLIGGSPRQPPLEVGQRIPSEVSVLEELTGKATTAADKADLLLDNLLLLTDQEHYSEKMGSLYDELLESTEQMNALLKVLVRASGRLDTTLVRTNSLLSRNEGHIDHALAEMDGALTQLHKTLVDVNELDVVSNFNATAESARVAVNDLRSLISSNRRQIAETLANLREASANLNEFSGTVRDRPSLLLRSTGPEPRKVPDRR